MPETAQETADPQISQSPDDIGAAFVRDMLASRNVERQREQAAADQPTPQPEPEEVQEQPDVSDQNEGEPTEQVEEQADGPDQGDGEESTSEDQSDDEPIEVMPTSIEELAEITETPLDDLLENITIRTQVYGEVKDVPLKEMKAEWQKGKDYDRRVGLLKQESEANRQHDEKRNSEHQQALAYIGTAANQYRAVLEAMDDGFMEDLRAENPQAAAVVGKLRRTLMSAQKTADETFAKQAQEWQENSQKGLMQRYNMNAQSLGNLRPDLMHAEKGPKLGNALVTYLTGRGMAQQDIQQILSYPGGDIITNVLIDAMEASEIKSDVKKVKRQIKGFRKAAKPGTSETPQTKATRKRERVAELVKFASANTKDTRAQNAAGIAVVRDYMQHR